MIRLYIRTLFHIAVLNDRLRFAYLAWERKAIADGFGVKSGYFMILKLPGLEWTSNFLIHYVDWPFDCFFSRQYLKCEALLMSKQPDWVRTVDSRGRITSIRMDFVQIEPIGGHSVCNECDKDMPKCWDTICARCRHTFCYEHSWTVEGKWVCSACLTANDAIDPDNSNRANRVN